MSSINSRGVSLRSILNDHKNRRKRRMSPNRIEAGHELVLHSNNSDTESGEESSSLDELNHTFDEIENESLEDLDRRAADNLAVNDEYRYYDQNDSDDVNGFNHGDVHEFDDDVVDSDYGNLEREMNGDGRFNNNPEQLSDHTTDQLIERINETIQRENDRKYDEEEQLERFNENMDYLENDHQRALDEMAQKQAKEMSKTIKLLRKKHKTQVDELRLIQRQRIRELVESRDKEMAENENYYSQNKRRKVEMKEELHSRLSSILPNPTTFIPECYVCLEVMKPPLEILNCTNGHLICSTCYPMLQVKVCGQCNGDITGKATAMEQMVRQILNVQ